MPPSYANFFTDLTGHPPYPYQLAISEGDWPDVLDIPTGLGKTAAVVVAWLHRRLTDAASTPRRLVYCLPMRVLVEQTADAAREWRDGAASAFEAEGREPPSVHVLMGGDVDLSWEAHPEREAILIGTQDMLLSRALNRGYAMSRYKWPVHFGLLNNDCLWVFDETQLMGVAVETSAQLDAFRRRLGTHGTGASLWMSATLGREQLATVDHPKPPDGWRSHTLSSADRDHGRVVQRIRAAKPLRRAATTLASSSKAYADELAQEIVDAHRDGLTLVVLNRVGRAQDVYAALHARAGTTALALVHSRFRPADRERAEATLTVGTERIVVATQAVEAGVDVSATTLITELAPWPSLVQRFGRCNRYGETEGAVVRWIDLQPKDEKDALSLPYDAQSLQRARAILAELEDVGPGSLAEVDYTPASIVRPVLRRRDLLELFDTTPDLCGDDIDVSRFIRDGEDNDVQLFWRDFDGVPNFDDPPQRAELCSVSVRSAREFMSKLARARKRLEQGGKRGEAQRLHAYRYRHLARAWEPVTTPLPGQTLLLHPGAGGYDPERGWTGEAAAVRVEPVSVDGTGDEAMDADPDAVLPGQWIALSDHLGHVRDEAARLGDALELRKEHVKAVRTAGLWHDVGKAHPEFQRRLIEPVADDTEVAPPAADTLWAKSSHRRKARSERRHFRHELASALAWLQAGGEADEPARSLTAYLVAAHHGKVRVSIRSLPTEIEPDEAERLFARGVWQGDELPALTLPDGRSLGPIALDLSPMLLGEGSWLERTLALRDDETLGPFRLALLELVVRVADWRASRKEERGAYDA